MGPVNHFVSVIIPTYNHAAYVGQAVESVLVQTYRDFEVLVSGKCFFDGIEEVLGLKKQTIITPKGR